MTPRTSSKRSSPSPEDGSQSDSASTRCDEKTIPFLRRLTDMLIENEQWISFTPGHRKNGDLVLGKIEVHDRVKVESCILPRYFNHSSFASLRRQLNYFSFTRVGKGRQRGATYCNEGVVELEDILNLRRRSVNGDSGKIAESKQNNGSRQSLKQTQELNAKKNPNKRLRTMANSSSSSNNNSINQTPSTISNLVTARVSPVDNLVNSDHMAPKRISLDLTGCSSPESTRSVASVTIIPGSLCTESLRKESTKHTVMMGDDDVLAGCRALLCFSRGIPSN